MKLHWNLLSAVCLLSFCTFTQGLFDSSNFQDYVNNFVDAVEFQLNGMLSLNNSAINHIWSYFKTKYGRIYSSLDEEKQRLKIFRDHLKLVLESNLQKARTFQLELNEFADWTSEEFSLLKKGLNEPTNLRRRTYYDLRRTKRNMINRRYHQKYNDRRGLIDWISDLLNIINSNETNNNNIGQSPSSFDWRSKNVVSSIKDQLKCGSCYAFATAAVLESVYAIKTKSRTITEFSPQQIVDCSSNGNNGCKGGSFAPSIRYLVGQGGKFATFTSYPYSGSKQTCKTSSINQVKLGNIQYKAIEQNNEKAMAAALVNYGPLFIGLDIESELFTFYKSGILNVEKCPNRLKDMDHAMVVVGYGYDNTLKMPYWIIKNSWSTRWGENGYIRLAKDKGNMCGIATMAYYAQIL